ncbi:MAG: ATP-binding protein [Deltaproteobacteria bacterium]|nr:ATP-binding protein [Deltaproteobacteria bacterium]
MTKHQHNESRSTDVPGEAMELDRLRARVRELEATVEALRASETAFRSLADNAHDTIMRFDRDHRHLYVNPIVEEQTHLSAADFLGKTHEELGFPKDLCDLWADAINSVFESGAPGRIEFELPSNIWIDWLLVPERGDDGAVRQVVTFARDITDRKHAEQMLNDAMRDLAASNVELRSFAHVASHDLQEPLRTITGYLQLLLRRFGDGLDPEAREFIGFAADGAQRMQAMIGDLLRYARVETRGREFEAVDCEEVARHTLTDLSEAVRESKAQIVVDELPVVLGDAGQLSQVFLNLIGNAIKFRGPDAPTIHVGAVAERGRWVFFVKDNGIGIDADDRKRIFYIFHRLHTGREYPGTGVGLAICRKIIERHDGKIWVDGNVDGPGSTFYFSLPDRR